MVSKIRNLVEYSGIADELPLLDNPSSFKQFCLHESFQLPEAKPDISRLVKVITDINILDNRVIRTPNATSVEGQRLTGFKLMIDGTIELKVEYVGEATSQAVHALFINVPFSTFVVLPESFKTGASINISGYIEDVAVNVFDGRNIFMNAIILAVADF